MNRQKLKQICFLTQSLSGHLDEDHFHFQNRAEWMKRRETTDSSRSVIQRWEGPQVKTKKFQLKVKVKS